MVAWGVLMTEPQRHQLASEQLTAHSFEFFLPMREHTQVAHGRHHKMLIPYFGRYVFVVICEAWEKILELRGVSSLLLERKTLFPWLVDSDQLAYVRSQCDENGIVRPAPVPPVKKLRYGDVVYTENGPLANKPGVYDCVVGKNREAALFNMFGRENRVLFLLGELKPVSRNSGRWESRA
jgi:transcription antitermination factor NusG